jgi:putative nucleotidyltransferase with HDIG domain
MEGKNSESQPEVLSPKNVEKVRKRFLNEDSLPTISTMFEKIVHLLEDERSTISDIEKVVRLDQVIATRILKLVNSAFFGFNNVTSISHAISLLGFKRVQNVVLSASLANVFDTEYSIGSLAVSDFWLHSIAAACISKVLSERTGQGDPEELFTLGLLHDIGKVLYLKAAPELFQALLERAHARCVSLNQQEEELGLSHALLGWFLCEKWNFPSKIGMVLKRHHRMTPEDEFALEEAVVNMADYLALRLGIGSSGNKYPTAPGSVVTSQLKLSKRIWEAIKQDLQVQKESIIKLSQELLVTAK